MGMFDPDEDPTYIKMESQLDKIEKILKADFLNDKEKLFFIERIIFVRCGWGGGGTPQPLQYISQQNFKLSGFI